MKDYDIRECSNEEADFVIDKLVEYNLSKVASTQEIDFLNIDRVVEDVKINPKLIPKEYKLKEKMMYAIHKIKIKRVYNPSEDI